MPHLEKRDGMTKLIVDGRPFICVAGEVANTSSSDVKAMQLTIPRLAQTNRDADAKAFAAVMKHIRQVDSKDHTVIAVQVENEVGVLARRRSTSWRRISTCHSMPRSFKPSPATASGSCHAGSTAMTSWGVVTICPTPQRTTRPARRSPWASATERLPRLQPV
jgi:hypothetical protein